MTGGNDLPTSTPLARTHAQGCKAPHLPPSSPLLSEHMSDRGSGGGGGSVGFF